MKLKYPTNYIVITKGYKVSHLAIDLGWNSKYGGKNVPVYACGNGVVSSIRDGRDNTNSACQTDTFYDHLFLRDQSQTASDV